MSTSGLVFTGEDAAAQTAVATPAIPPQPVLKDPPTYQERLDALGISGYASKPSVRPGETIDIKVSTKNKKYKAELVRIVHGDADPIGPGIKETVVDTPANGEYDGVFQPIVEGSYVRVDDAQALDLTSSFTITAWVACTTIPGSDLNPIAQDRTPVKTPRPQGIVSKWDDKAGSGYGLFVAEDGSLGIWLGGGDGKVQKLSTGVRMNPYAPGIRSIESGSNIRTGMTGFTTWYFVAASYDAATGKVSLYQEPQKGHPNPTRAVVTLDAGQTAPAANEAPLLIGAGWANTDAPGMGGLFNGKIDSPRIYDKALSADEIAALREDSSRSEGAVAAWDFSKEISTAKVVDAANGHDGTAVNNPVRAVTGHSWRDGTMDYRTAPEMYGALYFHEDDIADARWDTSVQFTIPEDAKSGNYGVRLTADDGKIYHAAFTVLPKEGTHADIAYMVPTLSYLAYGAIGIIASQYHVHRDGSGTIYSGWNRPIPNMRPYTTGLKGEGKPWQYEADTHITDWIESTGYKVDYITDHDVNANPDILKDYKVVITGSHPEYISTPIWHGLETWLNGGGRLMYMGGNGYYWVTAVSEDGTFTELRRHDGTEAYQVPAGEYHHSLTGEFGGLWRFRGYAPQELVGVGFTAQGFASLAGPGAYGRPYTIADGGKGEAGSWVFKDVDTSKPMGDFAGLQGPGGPGGEELDRVEYSLGTPASTIVLAVSSGFGDEYVHVVEEVNTSNIMQGGTVNPLVRADMALMYYPNGGAVWSSSSISWGGSLFYNNYDNEIARITRNVLDKFVSGEPLPAAPEEK
jgi:N,N-dimethylformamidase